MAEAKWEPPAIAELDLGDFTDAGQGATADEMEAVKRSLLDEAEMVRRFRKTADEGDGRAQFIVALMYAEGKGVPRDKVAACLWAELAAARTTGKIRDDAVKFVEHLAATMDQADIARVQEWARSWSPKEKCA